ncbi:MAG: HdeA/HdeB family chaperone [Pseudolabrys sp.]
MKKLLLVLAVLLAAPAGRAQVTVDVAKITCTQLLSFSVADPKDIAVWLSGYYHGRKGSAVMELERFKANAEKLKSACFLKANAALPVMQVIEKIFGQPK